MADFICRAVLHQSSRERGRKREREIHLRSMTTESREASIVTRGFVAAIELDALIFDGARTYAVINWKVKARVCKNRL